MIVIFCSCDWIWFFWVCILWMYILIGEVVGLFGGRNDRVNRFLFVFWYRLMWIKEGWYCMDWLRNKVGLYWLVKMWVWFLFRYLVGKMIGRNFYDGWEIIVWVGIWKCLCKVKDLMKEWRRGNLDVIKIELRLFVGWIDIMFICY